MKAFPTRGLRADFDETVWRGVVGNPPPTIRRAVARTAPNRLRGKYVEALAPAILQPLLNKPLGIFASTRVSSF